MAKAHMRDEGLRDDYLFVERQPAALSRPRLVLIAALLTVLLSAATCALAILAPAPPAAVPLVLTICVGCPMFSGWEVPNAVAALRARRGGKELAKLRRTLDDLPETEHPLGL